MGGFKNLKLFLGFFFFSIVLGKRTCNSTFVCLYYGRSGEEIYMGHAMAASGQMQYDYKLTY